MPSIILNKLFKNLRVISTALSFLIFMIWGFLLGVTLFPILKLLVFNKTRRRRVFINHMRLTWRIFIKIMELLRAFKKIEVLGLENFEQNRASLVIANHITLVDIVAIGSRLENFNCVVKRSLWNQPFLGSVVKACDFIPNSGSEAFITQCERGFNDERPLVVFPEGTRKLPDDSIEFQRGVSQIAARIDVPIVPVIVECYPVTLSKGLPWYKVPDRAPHLKLTFQKPLDLPEDIRSMTPMPKKVRAINRFLEDYYKAALK